MDEQLDRRGHAGPVTGPVERERRHHVDRFAVEAERFATGHQQRHGWAVPVESGGDVRGGLEHVLTVVEHDQGISVAVRRYDTVKERLAALLTDAQRLGQRVHDRVTLGDLGQFAAPDAVAIAVPDRVGSVESQRRLADAAATDKGDDRT